jgi:hypothetical protein
MSTVKDEVRQLLESLPEDVSYEDIQYHIYVRQSISHGIDAADRGEMLELSEVEQRMKKWTSE